MYQVNILPCEAVLETLANPNVHRLGTLPTYTYNLRGSDLNGVGMYLAIDVEGVHAQMLVHNDGPISGYTTPVYKFPDTVYASIEDALARDPHRVACAFTAMAYVFGHRDMHDKFAEALLNLTILAANGPAVEVPDDETIDNAGDYWEDFQLQARTPGVSVLEIAEISEHFISAFYGARAICIHAPRDSGVWGYYPVTQQWLPIEGVSVCCLFARATHDDGLMHEMLVAQFTEIVVNEATDVRHLTSDDTYLARVDLAELHAYIEEFEAGQFAGEVLECPVPKTYGLEDFREDFGDIESIYEDMLTFTCKEGDTHNVITVTKVDELSRDLA